MQCGLYAIILQEFAQINWQPFSLQPGYSYQQLFSVIDPSAPGDTTVYPAFKLKAEKPSFVYRLSVRLTLSLSSAYTVSVLSVNMSVSESVSLSVNLTVVCLSVCLSVNMSVSEYVCL